MNEVGPWPPRQLSDLLDEELRNGRSPSASGPLQVKVLTLSAVTGSGFRPEAIKIGTYFAHPTSHESVDSRDFLVCRGNGSLGLVGKGFFPTADITDAYFPDTMIAVRPSPSKIDKGYLEQIWQTYHVREQIESRARTTNGTYKVNQQNLGEISIPVPPLDAQRRIAALLGRADAVRILRREAVGRLDELTQAIFIEMFGDVQVNNCGWPKAEVSDIVKGFEGGKSLVADDAEDSDAEFRVLKVSAVTSGIFNSRENKAVPLGYTPPRDHLVRSGDLLFSRANTAELVGATALVEGAVPGNLLLPDKLWRFVWRSPRAANPAFVHQMFCQPRFRYEIGSRATGTSASMKNISQAKVLSIRFGLPPLELQDEFARRVAVVQNIRHSYQSSLASFEALFASLQHRVFWGGL